MKGDDLPIIVMDVEWTAWEGSRARNWSGPGEEMELVQIGAVKLADTPDLREIDSFEILIKPRINGILDRYFIDLTGITQERLDREGVDLAQAVPAFHEFAGACPDILGFGNELTVIESNCRLYGLDNPFSVSQGRSIRDQVTDNLEAVPPRLDSSELPKYLNFDLPGQAHQALADSRCIAEAIRRLRAIDAF